MEIVHNNALLVRTRDPDKITQVIQKSKVIKDEEGVAEVLVQWNLGHAMILKNLGFKKVLSPILGHYSWPGMYKPFAHQKDTAAFLTIHKRAFCLNAMGTGKSAAAAWAADYLLEQKAIRRVLIICPLSIMDCAWRSDLFKTVMHRRVGIAHGSREQRVNVIKGNYDFVIINYDGVEVVRDELARGGFDLIIADECFPKGTQVVTPNGSKSIDTVSVGDIVETSWGPRPVTRVFKKKSDTLVEVRFEDGRSITCTEEHPFATTEGWMPAKNIKGKRCITQEDLPHLRKAFCSERVQKQKSGHILFTRLLEKTTRSALRSTKLPTLWERAQAEVKRSSSVLFNYLCGAGESGSNRRNAILHRVRETFFCSVISTEVQESECMFRSLRQQAAVEKGGNTEKNDGGCSQIRFDEHRKTSMEQGYSLCRKHKREIKRRQKQRSLFSYPWRKWHRNVESRGTFISSFTRFFCAQFCSEDLSETGQRLSDALQNGLCRSNTANSYRSGWVQPQQFGQAGARPEERSSFEGVRVVSVTYIEQSCMEDVWNLEVEGPHDYVVNGVLVHNCTALKNAKTRRWKAFNSLIGPDTWVWLMTGTPAAQSPEDAYGQAKIVNPSAVPSYAGAFKDKVMIKVTQFKWIPRPEAQEIVHSVLQPAIRYTTEECLDLPEQLYTTYEVPMTAQQEKYYSKLRKEMLIQAAGEEVSAVNAAVQLGKLLQISSGAVYSDTGEVVQFDASNKLNEMLNIVQGASHKTLIFCAFRHSIDTVQEFLQKHGISSSAIHGGVSAKKRTEIFRNFQESKEPEVLVIQPQAAAHGVTLTAANTVIWFSPTTSAETYLQANARVHRAGQRNPCLVVHLCSSGVEKQLYKALEDRTLAQSSLLSMYKNFLGGDI